MLIGELQMIPIDIPGYKTLELKYLVLDYNGTLAVDGLLLPDVGTYLNTLSKRLEIHVVTADTFGAVTSQLQGINCELAILGKTKQAEAKQAYIQKLGADFTAAIGNGRNDRLMLKTSALGIVVLQEEGAAVETLLAADVTAPDIITALNLLNNPLRLVAALRS